MRLSFAPSDSPAPCPRRARGPRRLMATLACLVGLAGPGLASGPAAAQAGPAQNRGELLYGTHCIACHTTEVHWRGRKLVSDWSSLLAQVRRWQSVQQLNWSDDDIVQVARHLNRRFYKVKETGDKGQRTSAATDLPGPVAAALPRGLPTSGR